MCIILERMVKYPLDFDWLKFVFEPAKYTTNCTGCVVYTAIQPCNVAPGPPYLVLEIGGHAYIFRRNTNSKNT